MQWIWFSPLTKIRTVECVMVCQTRAVTVSSSIPGASCIGIQKMLVPSTVSPVKVSVSECFYNRGALVSVHHPPSHNGAVTTALLLLDISSCATQRPDLKARTIDTR